MSEKENTVSAVNQMQGHNPIMGRADASPKIAFVGNSITCHFIAEAIGWPRQCGMAASSLENDYVHQVMKAVREIYPNADASLALQADWERAFWEGEKPLESTREVREWKPDVVVIRVGENTGEETLSRGDYAQAVVDMARYFGGDHAKYVVTDQFWRNEKKNECLRRAAEMLNAEFASITDLGDDITMTACGLFEHGGVACHPGDKGMRAIADRILEKLLPLLAGMKL